MSDADMSERSWRMARELLVPQALEFLLDGLADKRFGQHISLLSVRCDVQPDDIALMGFLSRIHVPVTSDADAERMASEAPPDAWVRSIVANSRSDGENHLVGAAIVGRARTLNRDDQVDGMEIRHNPRSFMTSFAFLLVPTGHLVGIVRPESDATEYRDTYHPARGPLPAGLSTMRNPIQITRTIMAAIAPHWPDEDWDLEALTTPWPFEHEEA